VAQLHERYMMMMMMMMMMMDDAVFYVGIYCNNTFSRCMVKMYCKVICLQCNTELIMNTTSGNGEISLVFGLAVHINTIWLCVLSVKLRQSTRSQKRCACLYGDRLVNNLRNVTAHLHMHSRTEGQTDKSPL